MRSVCAPRDEGGEIRDVPVALMLMNPQRRVTTETASKLLGLCSQRDTRVRGTEGTSEAILYTAAASFRTDTVAFEIVE